MLEAMAVGDAGKMAVCVDPTGAVFGLWQPMDFIGAAVEDEHGSLAWSEVNTRDAAAACEFYGKLFGLTARKAGRAGVYLHAVRGVHRALASCRWMSSGVTCRRTGWATSPSTTLTRPWKRVLAAGGSIGAPAFDTPYGRIAVIVDPNGATISVVQLPS